MRPSFEAVRSKVVLAGHVAQRVFDDAGLAVRDFDDGVFEAGGLGEEQHGLLARREGWMREKESGASSGGGSKEITASGE